MIKKISSIVLFISVILHAEPAILPTINVGCKYSKKKCTNVLNELCIDPDIKTVVSWKRVCNNNKLSYYVCGVKKEQLMKEACFCLTHDENTDMGSNSFYIFKDKK